MGQRRAGPGTLCRIRQRSRQVCLQHGLTLSRRTWYQPCAFFVGFSGVDSQRCSPCFKLGIVWNVCAVSKQWILGCTAGPRCELRWGSVKTLAAGAPSLCTPQVLAPSCPAANSSILCCAPLHRELQQDQLFNMRMMGRKAATLQSAQHAWCLVADYMSQHGTQSLQAHWLGAATSACCPFNRFLLCRDRADFCPWNQ